MIHWGVIGYGNIAKRFIQSLAYSNEGKLYAIASHHLSSFDSDVILYQDYDALIHDEHVDAIYIALRHQDHYEYAKKALLNHKAVLCEKPATLSYAQTKELCELSKKNHVFFMEGMKSRFIPLMEDIKDVLSQRLLGDVHYISTSFCNAVSYKQGSYLFDYHQGGALYDVGVYNIALMLDLFDDLPQRIDVYTKKQEGIDYYVKVDCDFGKTKFMMEAAIDREKEKALIIEGSLGSLKAVPFYRPTSAELVIDNEKRMLHRDYVYDDFYGEIMEVHRCLMNNEFESPRMSHDDSLRIMAFVERIKGDVNW